MSTNKKPVWFCPREVIDHNRDLARIAHMDIRKLKAIKALVVSLAILGVAAYGIHSGGDPTTISWLGLAGLLLVNGIEVGELLAVMSAARDDTSGEEDS
ncbi:hypothetical protein [Halorussus halobius]|uniref:hypothetical protein n=1 Tax=Halorussus halobius TaxID=1710537 RepID=UPI0010922A03|nr:hypothetical protein [Halorussus halobius]